MSSMPTFERERPNALLRVAFKLPSRLYHGPVAMGLASRCVMRLTTIGRTSGSPRTVCISFMPEGDGYIVFSGFGIESNWYRNLLANAEAEIKVGRETIRVNAAVVEDPAERKQLMLQMQECSKGCGPPAFIRPLLRLTRAFDYDAEIQMAVDQAEAMPVVRLTPLAANSGQSMR